MANPPSRDEIEARIERIEVLIAGARRLLGENRDLDLSILAFAVADLRDGVRTASAAATAGLAPRVRAVRAAADRLGDDLAQARAAARPAASGTPSDCHQRLPRRAEEVR